MEVTHYDNMSDQYVLAVLSMKTVHVQRKLTYFCVITFLECGNLQKNRTSEENLLSKVEAGLWRREQGRSSARYFGL